MRKIRIPIIAAFFSLLFPGGGQIYNGQPVKGVVLFVGAYALHAGLSLIGLQYHLYGLVAQAAASTAYRVYVAADAFVHARRAGVMELGPLNRTGVYLGFVLAAMLLGAQFDPHIRDTVYRAYMVKVADQAMAPAVMDGDNVLADARPETLAGLKQGDVAVFAVPEPPHQEMLARVAALPGDVVEIRGGEIFVNGEVFARPVPAKTSGSEVADGKAPDNQEQDADSDAASGSDASSGSDAASAPNASAPEDGDALAPLPVPIPLDAAPFPVPEGAVYLIRDDLSHGPDSRTMGPVLRQDLLAKVLFVYWSMDSERIGLRLDR